MPKGLPVVPRLLTDLKIESLVIVDDEFETAGRPAVEEIIGAVRSGLAAAESPERARVLAAFAELGVAESGPWDEQLRRRWEAGDDVAKDELAARVVGSEGTVARPLSAALAAIASWFGEDGPALVTMTPAQWEAGGKELIDKATGSVVCLFDEELGPGRKGTLLMQAAMADSPAEDRFFFGLLTGTTDRAGEDARTETLQRAVESDRVIVIEKGRAAEPDEFAARLRLVVQLTYHNAFRSIARGAMTSAMGKTTEHLDALTVADFDRIVLLTATQEGTWEADELLRLIGIWERTFRREEMLAKRGEIEALLSRIRVARPSSAQPEPASALVRQLRHFELYAGDDINAAYLPIELGDIFSLGDGREYALMVQPCDIVVRKDGTRNRDPRVAPLVAIAQKANGTPPGGPTDSYHHLEYYESTEGGKAYLLFTRVALLPLSVLDLVSFRPDGAAALDPAGAAPAGLLASMAKRHRVLARAFKVVDEDVAAAEAMLAAEHAATELKAGEKPAVAATPNRGKGTAASAPAETPGARLLRLAWTPYTGDNEVELGPARSGGELRFGPRRVGRILGPQAAAALLRFHQFGSRPAFEGDFAREYVQAAPSERPAEAAAAPAVDRPIEGSAETGSAVVQPA
jgi:hypothetical protein